MTQYFITSTGTEIGKTFITAGLVHQARANGINLRAFKPIISGVTDTTMAGSDTEILAAAQDMPANITTWDSLSPLRFKAPLAPNMAAELEGRSLDYDQLISLCKGWLSDHDDCLIEGVGGSFVPLVDDYLVVDWIRDLGLPSILVAGSYLGTISHTLATVEAMTQRGLKIDRIIISQSEGADHPDLERTRKEITRHTKLPTITVPRIHSIPPWKDLPPLG